MATATETATKAQNGFPQRPPVSPEELVLHFLALKRTYNARRRTRGEARLDLLLYARCPLRPEHFEDYLFLPAPQGVRLAPLDPQKKINWKSLSKTTVQDLMASLGKNEHSSVLNDIPWGNYTGGVYSNLHVAKTVLAVLDRHGVTHKNSTPHSFVNAQTRTAEELVEFLNETAEQRYNLINVQKLLRKVFG